MSGQTKLPEWVPRTRDYHKEASESVLPGTKVEKHPLFVESKVETPLFSDKSALKEKKVLDPLSTSSGNLLATTTFDPLLGEYKLRGVSSGNFNESREPEVDDYPNWALKKADVLAKYTTNKTIPVPSFVQGVKPVSNVPVDRVKDRLEQLDQDDDDGEMLQLTQKEYQRHIERKRESLISAWNGEKRVRALKIAIKCAKLLGNTFEVVQFYPSKFVLVTEILDTFGDLVFERIKERSTIFDDDIPIPLKENFRCEDVADTAKETCKNWFYKIASIRELIPRILVEMSIIKSYRFLENDTFPQIFTRLNSMIRGIADPLVSMYCRVYLARKGREVMRHQKKKYLITGFDDFLLHLKLFKTQLAQHITDRGVTLTEYYDLFTPAMEYILECLAYEDDPSTLKDILTKYQECENGVLLRAILQSFQPRLTAKYAPQFVKFIKSVNTEEASKISLYRTLGLNLGLAEPPYDSRVKILNNVWKDVTEETDLQKYMETAEVWIQYPLSYLTWKEANILLQDILAHVTPDKKYFDFQPLLQSIMNKVLNANNAEFHAIFGMSNFLPFLDLFRGETQTEVNKALLETFTKSVGTVSDAVTINTMFSVAKNVHDSVTAMSFEDQKREIGVLLKAFLRKLDFGKELDKQLNFYVEARRAFANLDVVKVALVKAVCGLAVQTIKAHKLSKEISAFLRACIAYAFITIPAVESEFERLYLYVWGGEVALLCQSLPQADEMFKSAINLIQEVPMQVEQREGKWVGTSQLMAEFIQYFVSILVSVPGHPSHGPFYLLEALLKVVKSWSWDAKSTGKVQTYINVLLLLAANYQRQLPFKWDNVDSNDLLYGNTKKHLNDIQTLINRLVREIITDLDAMTQSQAVSKQEQGTVVVQFIIATMVAAQQTPEAVDFIMSLVQRLNSLEQGPKHLPTLLNMAKASKATDASLLRRLLEETQIKVKW